MYYHTMAFRKAFQEILYPLKVHILQLVVYRIVVAVRGKNVPKSAGYKVERRTKLLKKKIHSS